MSDPGTALARFQARLARDPVLADALGEIEDARAVEAVVDAARRCGISLTADAVAGELRPDPLGVSRWQVPGVSISVWPGPAWLPVHVSPAGGELFVDWAHVGGLGLAEPFFEGTVLGALARPFNRLFRSRMRFDDFVSSAPLEAFAPPAGFIFHMSRCGSTLAAAMLGAIEGHMVVSEPSPLDAVVQLCRLDADGAAGAGQAALTAMVGAFSRAAAHRGRRLIIKLDAWHALALPLFRRVFPDVPWVFMYRDPVEVLVSQRRERGPQLVPGLMAPACLGVEPAAGESPDVYTARVLDAVCESALDANNAGGGRLVNYRHLPEAVWTTIGPHFNAEVSAADRDRQRVVARRDVKRGGAWISPGASAERDDETALLAPVADRHLARTYRLLEAARSSSA